MEQINRQVARARRRLAAQQFLTVLPWCWLTTLGAAAMAIAAHKWFWPDTDSRLWLAWSLGGGVASGLLAALVGSAIARRGKFQAAWEIDHRFDLKERVSTALALNPEQGHSACGLALLDDAAHRVSRLDVARQFPLIVSRRFLWPLAPIMAAILIFMLPETKNLQRAGADLNHSAVGKQIAQSIAPLEKKIDTRARQAEQNNFGALSAFLTKLADELRNLSQHEQANRHEALAQLHDLTQELNERSEQLAQLTKLKQYLAATKDIPTGPAGKLAQEFANGNFENALADLKQLQDELSRGQLDAKQQAELAQQMAAKSEAIRKAFEQHQPAQKALQQQLDTARQSGDQQLVQRLQQQLAKLAQQQPAIDAAGQFADQFAHLAKSAQAHNAHEALSAVNQLAARLAQVQQQSQEMELIEATLSDIDGAKMVLSGSQGGAEATAKFPSRTAGTQGIGHREAGAGAVAEPLQAQTFDSVVKSQPSGSAAETAAGSADGPNIKGRILAQIKTELQAARTESADPISSETLPRAQHDHVQQYFDAFRSRP